MKGGSYEQATLLSGVAKEGFALQTKDLQP
jgi:hypothetical protein